MNLPLRETEGVPFDLRHIRWLLSLEIEAQERADDGS